ncbi:MAG: hypothetical protein NZ958_06165 [Bacteroidia bacterium]|nr:hypothetical protein [Bacteroidia bacterium]MDW8088797.1 hypothetical protein [Bacteroidia bacterium]
MRLSGELSRWILWFLTAVGAGVGLLFLGQRRTLRRSAAGLEALAQAFWRLELGETLGASVRQAAFQYARTVQETDTPAYALGVAYTLLYAADQLEGGSPMVYIQRLRQMTAHPVARAYLARLSWHIGQPTKARQYLAEVLQQDSACGLAYLLLARLEPDSACVWLRRGATAKYYGAESHAYQILKARLRCP